MRRFVFLLAPLLLAETCIGQPNYGSFLNQLRTIAHRAEGPGLRFALPEDYVRIDYNNIPGLGRIPIPNLGLNPDDPDAKFGLAPGADLFGTDRGDPVPPFHRAAALPLHVARPLPLVLGDGGLYRRQRYPYAIERRPFAVPDGWLEPQKTAVVNGPTALSSVAHQLPTHQQQTSAGMLAMVAKQLPINGRLSPTQLQTLLVQNAGGTGLAIARQLPVLTAGR